ncbi:hypothetical protein, partial [Salmonella sp. SAL4458]|uniref:hypothetical protein n=1 Tax=Salmonella sp. SAL4458 TaxID=3159913 RepID=UPI0039788691
RGQQPAERVRQAVGERVAEAPLHLSLGRGMYHNGEHYGIAKTFDLEELLTMVGKFVPPAL